jgi:hypothetical protein
VKDFPEMMDDFLAQGLISHDFAQKLASSVATRLKAAQMVKQATPEQRAPLLKAAGEKIAFFGATPPPQGIIGTILSNPLGQQLAVGAAVAGATGLKNLMGRVIENQTYNKSYSTMMDQNPGMSKADPKVIQRTFDVVRQYAPDVAKNPTMAGAFVNNVIQFPDATPTMDDVRRLTDIQKQIENTGGGSGNLMGTYLDSMVGQAGAGFGRALTQDPNERKQMDLRTRQMERDDWWDSSMLGQGARGMGLVSDITGGIGAPGRMIQDLRGGLEAWQDKPDPLKQMQVLKGKYEMGMGGGEDLGAYLNPDDQSSFYPRSLVQHDIARAGQAQQAQDAAAGRAVTQEGHKSLALSAAQKLQQMGSPQPRGDMQNAVEEARAMSAAGRSYNDIAMHLRQKYGL